MQDVMSRNMLIDFSLFVLRKRKVFLSFVIVFISVGMEMDKVVKADQQVTAPPPQSCCRVCVCAG